jgi:hypothetical protein
MSDHPVGVVKMNIVARALKQPANPPMEKRKIKVRAKSRGGSISIEPL